MHLLKLAVIHFLSALGLKLWPHAEPFLKKCRFAGLVLFFIVFAVIVATLFVGCVSPRSNSIFGLQFIDHAPKLIMRVKCGGVQRYVEGVAVCEEKTPRQADVRVKIMPVPGRVVYSDGLKSRIDDFNYKETGWWIFKGHRIDTTWVQLDLGELNSIYGDIPIVISVQGEASTGVINVQGMIFHRICNDTDIPCSKLVVDFDCSGKIKNTYEGQLGECARIAESSQKFRIPIKTLGYELKQGSKVSVQAGRSGWTLNHTLTASDIKLGDFKFIYPKVLTGPELFRISVFQWEQDVLQEYHTYVLIVGYSTKWVGIDQPHLINWHGNPSEFCMPFLADLLELNESGTIKSVNKQCIPFKTKQACAYAYDRESGDMTHSCVKDGKEVRL